MKRSTKRYLKDRYYRSKASIVMFLRDVLATALGVMVALVALEVLRYVV
jgi:hypothetical protein